MGKSFPFERIARRSCLAFEVTLPPKARGKIPDSLPHRLEREHGPIGMGARRCGSAPSGRAADRGDRRDHALGRELVHALEVSERAFARETRAAFDPGPDDAKSSRKR